MSTLTRREGGGGAEAESDFVSSHLISSFLLYPLLSSNLKSRDATRLVQKANRIEANSLALLPRRDVPRRAAPGMEWNGNER